MWMFVFAVALSTVVSAEKCLDGEGRKQQPGREMTLYGECAKWREFSCCNIKTTYQLQTVNSTWYGFDYAHCGALSEKCRKRMLQDLCMYECDPYLEQWMVPDNTRKSRTERFLNIPFCANDCQLWYDDCKDDLTCVANWNTQFTWTGGKNVCPHGSECQKIHEVYSSPVEFCSLIWDYSFNVTSDSTNCISFAFENSHNPNKKVAEYYSTLADANTSSFAEYSIALLSISCLFVSFLIKN